uniref:Putative ovule protein n=1 Tax=Solanum chacoense TaxID=4108 RepID=A0A0V0IFY4_SOLCH
MFKKHLPEFQSKNQHSKDQKSGDRGENISPFLFCCSFWNNYQPKISFNSKTTKYCCNGNWNCIAWDGMVMACVNLEMQRSNYVE